MADTFPFVLHNFTNVTHLLWQILHAVLYNFTNVAHLLWRILQAVLHNFTNVGHLLWLTLQALLHNFINVAHLLWQILHGVPKTPLYLRLCLQMSSLGSMEQCSRQQPENVNAFFSHR